jgi:two-component system, NarL family, sensor histidine kinase DevS
MPSPDVLDEERLRRLIDAGRSLVSELDLESLLRRVLETAAEVTGARYAAVGILDEHRAELERFLTAGIGPEARHAIGDLPRGRGILGVLIDDPRPLRLESVGDDPRSYGFPPDHPPMTTFLGAPIAIRGEAWGNLYLTEKAGGEPFTAADEEATVVLAEWAAIAIDNARLYKGSSRRREELERAVRRLEASMTIARAVGGETDLSRVLELIVERGRALVGADGLLILLREHGGLLVAATAGDVPEGVEGSRLASQSASIDQLGLDPATTLTVPLVFRGQSLGLLAALGRRGGGALDAEDEPLLAGFAASAATAVATARSVEEDRLRNVLQGAEEERGRWARELHDETLQGLGALKLVLSTGRRGDDPVRLRAAVDAAVEQLEDEIDGLRSLIRELRPAALDELGPASAIEDLATRTAARHGVEVITELELRRGARHATEVEITLYRVIQESLTNAVKHADADLVKISVGERDGVLRARIEDDGRGFDLDAGTSGFGLTGMRERVALLGGRLEVRSSPTGTAVTATLPVRGA